MALKTKTRRAASGATIAACGSAALIAVTCFDATAGSLKVGTQLDAALSEDANKSEEQKSSIFIVWLNQLSHGIIVNRD